MRRLIYPAITLLLISTIAIADTKRGNHLRRNMILQTSPTTTTTTLPSVPLNDTWDYILGKPKDQNGGGGGG